MMTYNVEIRNTHTNSQLNVTVDADSALEAIEKARAWNPGYDMMVSCQLVKANY